ncbi:MAG: (p)ppGpp synthetase [Candidatus Marinimicrobia bacterium]|nr:(p)ppGpp synthetase [Candidatus Neomarinimicrobiota bacterium]
MITDLLKKIRSNKSDYPQGFSAIINNLEERDRNESNVSLIWKAYQLSAKIHADQKRTSGEPYFTHCESVAIILSKWKIDVDTVIAGLLHDSIEDTDISKEDISLSFNKDVATLVEGVTKLSGIRFNSKKQEQAENFMKMFISMAKDIRVIIIKFADRLHNMSTIKYLQEDKQNRIALETKEVYVPLAHRLGMNNVKNQLEDLILKTLELDKYNDINQKVNNTKSERERFIRSFIQPIKKELNDFDINADVFGRAKHYSSILGKMVKRNKSFEEIYDLFAIRIIVNKVSECYATLGIIHQNYNPFQERFKDYIARPKRNGYQSIHTTVFTDKGRMVEVQIRTSDMDETAEIGVAAHWKYKNDKLHNKGNSLDYQIAWLREIYELLKSEDTSASEILELFKIDLFQDEIYVYTPTGELIELKPGSTPVDFAYHVHSEVGMHCKGAKVNDKIVPLNHELMNGDYVEIITSKNKSPNHSWLKFVQTTKAKTHIRRWIKKQEHEQSVALGKDILEKHLRKINNMNILKLIKSNPQLVGLNSQQSVYLNVGSGKLTVDEIVSKYCPEEDSVIHQNKANSLTKKFFDLARGRSKGVVVDGLNDIMLRFANCCNPIPGDDIIGYLTKGQGVTVHRAGCGSVTRLKESKRFISVDWDISSKRAFVVRLRMKFQDRKNLLKDLTEATSHLNINIRSIDMKAVDSVATCLLVVEITDKKQLNKLINKLQQVQSIDDIQRY